MSSSDPDLLYVLHIQERIERIEEIATQDRVAFDTSHILQDAVIRNFEVIGEAVKRLSPALTDRYPETPWRRVAGFRDVLIHNYMGVDLDEVWNVITKDLPGLKHVIASIRSDLEAMVALEDLMDGQEAQRRLKAIADGRDDVMSAEDFNRELDQDGS